MPGTMQPVRLADHLLTAPGSGSLNGESPRQSHKDASDSWSFSSGYSKETGAEAWTSPFGGHRLHHSPPHVKATMKTINRGSYPSQTSTSTSKIVDEALNVVNAHVSSVQEKQQQQLLHNLTLNELGPEQDELPPSLMASETSFSSIEYSGRSSATSRSSGTNAFPRDIPPSPLEQTQADGAEPEDANVIPPSLRKIAKKRRKENDGAGMDRSSFHHTKSSKEYLRKAQEALIIRDQLERGEQSDDSLGARVPVAKEVAERLLPNAPSVFARQGPVRSLLRKPTGSRIAPELEDVRSPPPRTSSGLSRSQSCNGLMAKSSPGSSQPSSSRSDDDCNPYEYEDPDAAVAAVPTRRMGTAQRRGSVTKFSLKAMEHAKAATERIMRLQGLRGQQESCERSPERRSATPTGRRRHPRHSTGMAMGGTQESTRFEVRTGHRSMPLGDWDATAEKTESSKYGYEDVAMVGDRFSAAATAPAESTNNPYGYEDSFAGTRAATATSTSIPCGYEDPDACTDKTHSNPYGYENQDLLPQQPRRRHPRPTRRGSVTKFSVGAANIAAAASESVADCATPLLHEKSSASSGFAVVDAADHETDQDRLGELKPTTSGGLDVFLSKQPASFGSRQFRKTVVNRTSSSSSNVADTADDLSRNLLSPHHGNSPRRTGSYRRPHRFGAESLRSDSFLSHGSGVSFEDDADSLAPDMESLCSIHDRNENNDFAPVPPPPPTWSPITPSMTPGRSRSGNSMRGAFGAPRPTLSNGSLSSEGFQLKPRKTSSGRTGTMVSIPADSEVAILPLAASGAPTEIWSESLMPAPVKRNPSNSSAVSCVQRASSNSSFELPASSRSTVPLPAAEVTADGKI